MGQQQFGIRFGKPGVNSIVVIACSLSTGNVTVTVNGIETVVSMLSIGTDNQSAQPQSGFVGDAVITGLQKFTKYQYSAEQNGNIITGYFWTAPGMNDDFILLPITCDNNTSLGGDSVGGYSQVRAIAESNPDKGVYFLHIDDHYGYMDLNGLDDTAGTGHKVTAIDAATGNTVYDYSLGAFASFGLYSELGNAYCTWGHNADRLWCMHNIPVLPSIGDHDSGANDMGMLIKSSDSSQFAHSQVVWNAFLAPFQGDNIHPGSQAWSHNLGCIKIIAPDAITLGSGDAEDVNAWDKATTIYSNAQVDSLIDACDDLSMPFKMLALANGIRYLADPPTRFNSGAQYPIAGNESFSVPVPAHAEYKKLMTDDGGLMSLPSCNGTHGVLMTVHGDHHLAKAVRHHNNSGDHVENFYGVSLGTINGSINFDSAGKVASDVVDGSTVEMIEGTYLSNDWWVVPFYVYGSRDIKAIEIDFIDKNGATLWRKTIVEKRNADYVMLLHDNAADRAVIVADTEAIPVKNLQEQQRTVVWRSIGAGIQAIDITLAEGEEPVQAFALVDHNLSIAGTVRLQAWNDAIDGVNQELDIALQTYQPVYGYGEQLYGEGLYGGYDAYINGVSVVDVREILRPILSAKISLALNVRYWRITVEDGSVNYYQAGRIYLGPAWQPARNFKWGSKKTRESRTGRIESRGGQFYSNPRSNRTQIDFNLGWLTDADRDKLWIVNSILGDHTPLIAVMKPIGGYAQESSSLYGVFDSLSLQQMFSDNAAAPVKFVEEL